MRDRTPLRKRLSRTHFSPADGSPHAPAHRILLTAPGAQLPAPPPEPRLACDCPCSDLPTFVVFPLFPTLSRTQHSFRCHCDAKTSFGSYFIFSFLAILQHMELWGQGSELSHSCDLRHSNTGSLTHCAGPGTEPAPSAPETPPIPLRHSGNSFGGYFRALPREWQVWV